MSTNQIKKSIWYAGVLCKFELEVYDIDKAQYWIDYYRGLGFKCASLHEGDRHQIYVELKTKGVIPDVEARIKRVNKLLNGNLKMKPLSTNEKMISLIASGECATMDEAKIYLIDCGEI